MYSVKSRFFFNCLDYGFDHCPRFEERGNGSIKPLFITQHELLFKHVNNTLLTGNRSIHSLSCPISGYLCAACYKVSPANVATP